MKPASEAQALEAFRERLRAILGRARAAQPAPAVPASPPRHWADTDDDQDGDDGHERAGETP